MNRFSSSVQYKNSSNGDCTEEPFKATFLWERIISHLERSVKIGRHIIALRWYDNCFHGSKAVGCLVAYLTSILPKPVKRAQAVVLCGKLQETGVIQCVKKKEEFREKGLYRFTHAHFWKSPLSSSDPEELVSPSQNILSKSRSVECLEAPAAPIQRLKGYASDSTVTVSTHKRKKRTRKISHKSSESTVKQKKLNDLTKGHKLPPVAAYRLGKVQPDSHTTRRPKLLIHERWSQLRETHYRQDRERRWSKVKPVRDWQALAELPPSILNTQAMSRSHSFSSAGELLRLQDKPTHRHSSGKWTVYGFI